MSTDNGIYILCCKDGYRVAHCQCIENIYYQCRRKDDLEFNFRYLYKYFNNCKVLINYTSAMNVAIRLYKEIINDSNRVGIVEYEIRRIGNGKFIFPQAKITINANG